ncbi:PorP/SprF family type IX secretion system membrane protein [Neolewinella agarilytica]|uniref:PorP/SprF family type IX secretion system membrane protein n=1 Tax=Neolewinella agarilytica TaxID=478744 RepID=UPI0023549D46|nr:PorP/SprF family type IX secretion system membrane protein [Neolewinella agarilytica]
MRLRRLLFLLPFLLMTVSLSAQDVHYTLHNYAPLWLNPANTGSFAGSIRVGGIYRGQWFSVPGAGINSPTAYADAPLAFGFRKQDWVGVGFSLVSDNAGDFDLSSTFFGLSAAYHLALDKKRQNVLTIGAQYGSTSYGFKSRLGIEEINISEELGGGGRTGESEFTDMSGGGGPGVVGNNNNNNDNYNDLNLGFKLKILMDPKKDNVFEAGISLLHLTQPDRTALATRAVMPGDTMPNGEPNVPVGVDPDARDRRRTLHAHARLDMEMSEKWRFQPTLFYQTSASNSSVSVQAWGRRQLKNDMGLRLGLGYRTADAAKVLFGIDAGQLRAALAYDITLSQARNVNSYQGAFELSAAYIFNIYKKPTVKPTILCPDI